MKPALYGRIFFGASAMLFGVIALMWHDLDTWQTLHSIWRLPFGSIVGACLMAAQIAGGIAMQHPRTARLASIILGVDYLLFSLACVPSSIAASNLFERYGGSFFQQFSLLCGAIALYSATETHPAKAVRFGSAGAPWTWSLCHFLHPESDSLSSFNGGLGSQVDSAQPDVLGHTHDDRVCTGGAGHQADYVMLTSNSEVKCCNQMR